MAVKSITEPAARGVEEREGIEPNSGVRPSRRAVYDQRLSELAAEVSAGKITREEGVERLVQAVVESAEYLVTPAGREGLVEHLRKFFATDPTVRKLLGY